VAFLSNVSIARANIAGPSTVFAPVSAGSRGELVQSSYAKAVSVQTSDAPVLTADPANAGGFSGADGTSYYVPAATVGKRQNNAQVPDVFFDVQKGQTILIVSFDLDKPAGVADGAVLLLVDNFGVTLRPTTGTPVEFTSVQVTPVSDAAKAAAFRIVAQTNVDENIVPGILRTDTNAWFDVRADLHYRLAAQAPPPPTGPRPIYRWGGVTRFTLDGHEPPVAAPATAPRSTTFMVQRFNPNFISTINQTTSQPPANAAPSDVKTARVLLSDAAHDGLSAYFPVENAHNKPIYAKIMTLDGSSDSTWTATSDGYLRSSAQPNQYYVLPDGFGLAIDSQTGMPAMSVLMIEVPAADGTTSYRVRVRFVVVPLLAADRLDRIRRTLRQEQDMAYADLVIGGYDKAVFTPSHLFDKLADLGPSVVGAAADSGTIAVDAANGFELVLDCSMEFYTMLTTLVTQADGLQGNVDITIHTDANTAFTSEVPVRLTLGAPASIPLQVTVEDPGGLGSTNACAVDVENTAGVDLSASTILATLLLKDDHMPYPSNAYDVSSLPQSLALKAGAKVRVVLVQGAQSDGGDVGFKIGGVALNFDPKTGAVRTPTPELPPWSSIAMNFAGVRLSFDPNQVLAKVHELASSTHMSSTAHLVSYLLKHPDQIPKSLTGLIGIHVQLKTGTATPIDSYLTTDATEQTVQIAFSFADLLAGLKPDEPTFQWRRCNMFAAKEGDWSDWASNTGHDLYVTPTGL
jgi:hypothetical protein